MKLSIVIPVYNEVETLPRLYDALLPVLRGTGHEYEVLHVDGGYNAMGSPGRMLDKLKGTPA